MDSISIQIREKKCVVSAGIGLVGCQVPEVPANLLRDRFTASLLIKHSQVGVVRRGVLNAVGKASNS